MKFAKSEECMKSELDLFAIPPTQASVDNAVWISKDATSGVPSVDGSLTFIIEKINDQYLDLSETFIDLTVSLVKLDTKITMASDVELGVINNLAHSIFSQVQVKFGGIVVENSNGLYGYKAHIQNLTNYTASEKHSLLYNEMYIEDRPEFFENTQLTNPKTK